MSSTYTVRSILGKTRLHRPDLREAEVDYLTQETVRKICRLTMLAQENLEYHYNGPIQAFTPVPSNGNILNRVHQVRFQDSVIEKPQAPTASKIQGPTGYTTGDKIVYAIVAVGPQGWVSKYSEIVSVSPTSMNTIATVVMPAPPTAPNGFYNFNLYKQVVSVSNDKTITAITRGSTTTLTFGTAQTYITVGSYVVLLGVGGMTALNGKPIKVLSATPNTQIVLDIDTNDVTTYLPYTSGGVATKISLSAWQPCTTLLTCQQGPIVTAIADSNNKQSGTITSGNATYTYVGFNAPTQTLSEVPTGDYRTLGEANNQAIRNSLPKPDAVAGTPNLWAYDAENDEVRLYPPPSVITKEVRLTCIVSYIPVGEIDEIPLLQESEDAVIYGTLAEAYMLPGPGQNLQVAKNYEIKFNYEMSNLKAVAIQGQSGRLTVTANPLGGRRRKPYGAWGSPWDNSWGW